MINIEESTHYSQDRKIDISTIQIACQLLSNIESVRPNQQHLKTLINDSKNTEIVSLFLHIFLLFFIVLHHNFFLS